MALIPKGTLSPNASDHVIGGTHNGIGGNTIIANSGVMKIGYVVEQSGVTTVARFSSASNRVLGVCVGICKADGTTATPDAGTTDTVTVASDNATNAKIYAQISVSQNTVFSALSSAAPGTTTGSNQRGYFIDAGTGASAGQVTESSAAVFSSGGNFVIHGVDPDDTTRILVSINEGVFVSGT